MARTVLWLIASLLFVLVLTQVDRTFNIPLRPFALSRSGPVALDVFVAAMEAPGAG